MRRIALTIAVLFGLSAPARALDYLGPVSFTFSTGLFMVLYVDTQNFVHGSALFAAGTPGAFVEPVGGRYLPGIGINLSIGTPLPQTANALYMNGDGTAQSEFVTINGSLGGNASVGGLFTWVASATRRAPEWPAVNDTLTAEEKAAAVYSGLGGR